jgi:hypothetical protein
MRAANGEQQVEFHNGSMIMFGARSMGFGRGFDEIDFEVYDEAQILDTKALEDMVAATNQARHEHGALLFFMGTPPRPSDPSEAFTARRRKARDGTSPNAIWLEIGADPASDPDDQSQWPLMNPSYPLRTPPEALERLRENLADDDSWNREGRGVWDEETEGGDLPYGRWLELSDSQARRGDKPVFGLELIGERRVWIAVAWKRDDGSSQVMLTNDGLPLPAHRAVVECQRLRDEWGGMVASAAFRDELEREGVDLLPMTASDFAAGCGLFADSILAGTVQHGNQKALNTAVKAARWRPALTSGERAFLFKDMPEVGPAGAAARALWGLENADPMPAIY